MQKLAALGPRGTFSDLAAREHLGRRGEEGEILYYPTIDDAFRAIGRECGRGVVPIENTLDGYVQRTLDLLFAGESHISTELVIPVAFSLAANVRELREIRRVYVQFKSNGQCRRFLNRLAGVEIVSTESNMESYYKVLEGKPGDAAVIPRHMLEGCPAQFTVEDVTDSASNFTRFFVVEPGLMPEEPAVPPTGGRLRIPLYILPQADEPGILYRILRGFAENRVNLVSIMSRPTKKNMGSYNFYLEIDGACGQKDVILQVLARLRERHTIKVLGVYTVR